MPGIKDFKDRVNVNQGVHDENIKNKVAAITGAGSGIGRMLAIQLAAESCHLAISDINKQGLKETEKLVGKGVKCFDSYRGCVETRSGHQIR